MLRSAHFINSQRLDFTLHVFLAGTICLLFVFLPSVVHASPLLQDDDPVAQCAKGVQLYIDNKPDEAFPLLEAGLANKEKAHFGNQDDLGTCALVLGLIYNATGNSPEALRVNFVALNVFRETANRDFEATVLNNIGQVYAAQGQYPEALEFYQRALAIYDELELVNLAVVGITLNNVGQIYDDQGQYNKALENYQRALIIARDEKNRKGEGQTLNNLGVLYSHQGLYTEALEVYQQALAIWSEIGEQADNGTTLNNIGLLYQNQGLYPEALEKFQQSLAIAREVGDRKDESRTLNNIGLVHLALGRYAEALEQLNEGLEIAREVGDRFAEGATINNLGQVFEAQGRYADALEAYQHALVIATEVGNRAGEGITLSNIGAVYGEQNRYTEALEFYQKGLALAQELGNQFGESQALNNIGLIYANQKRYSEGLESYQTALAISRNLNDRKGEAQTLNNIGSLFDDQEQYSEALSYYQQALTIRQQIGDAAGTGQTLNNIGWVYRAQGQYDEALLQFEQALVIEQEVGNRTIEGIILNNIGRTYEVQNRLTEALDYYERSIAVIETLRPIAGSEPARASYIAQFANLYDRTIRLYNEHNQLDKAFLISEKGRARAFLDSLATGYVELGDNETSNLYYHEQESYIARQAAQVALVKAKAQSPPDEKLIAALDAQLKKAEDDHEAVLSAITARRDALAQLVTSRSSVLTVSQTQALLDDQTTLLSYWVLDDQTLVFILTSKTLRVVRLPVERTVLYTQIRAFRNFVNTDTPYPETAIELYRSLIDPLKPYLSNSHLVIVPQGELHYVPFAALTDGRRYLIDDYSITYLPSASALPFIQQNTQESGGQPLIIGNPTTGDHNSIISFSIYEPGPLPFAEEEAKDVAGQLGVEPYLESQGTETLVKKQAPQAKILHVAAHGLFNPVSPLSSLIALAPDEENDGWLTVGEVYGLDLKNTSLVVLSACDTQIGQLTAGDEFVGLTRAFFFAGTPTVVASLWNVDDKSTAFLMEQFYTHLKEGMSKGEALRQAQIDTRTQFPNPYYWAAFVLTGDPGEVTGIKNEEVAETQRPILTPTSAPERSSNCVLGLSFSLMPIAIVWLSKIRRRMIL